MDHIKISQKNQILKKLTKMVQVKIVKQIKKDRMKSIVNLTNKKI